MCSVITFILGICKLRNVLCIKQLFEVMELLMIESTVPLTRRWNMMKRWRGYSKKWTATAVIKSRVGSTGRTEVGKQGEQNKKICYVKAVRRRVGSKVALLALCVSSAGAHGGKITVGVPLHTPAPSREQFYLRQHTVGRLAPSRPAPLMVLCSQVCACTQTHTQPENVALATKPQSNPLCP